MHSRTDTDSLHNYATCARTPTMPHSTRSLQLSVLCFKWIKVVPIYYRLCNTHLTYTNSRAEHASSLSCKASEDNVTKYPTWCINLPHTRGMLLQKKMTNFSSLALRMRRKLEFPLVSYAAYLNIPICTVRAVKNNQIIKTRQPLKRKV